MKLALNLSSVLGLAILGLVNGAHPAEAATCLEVTLTGTQGGPPVFNGLAGAGTLVRYGTEENGCSSTILQFDAGAGHSSVSPRSGCRPVRFRRSSLPTFIPTMSTVSPICCSCAVICIAGPEGRYRLQRGRGVPDRLCNDVAALTAHVGDAYIQSGEMAQRLAENGDRLPGGPADLIDLATFEASNDIVEVWQDGDVVVTAVGSRHVPGHVSFRVDHPRAAP